MCTQHFNHLQSKLNSGGSLFSQVFVFEQKPVGVRSADHIEPVYSMITKETFHPLFVNTEHAIRRWRYGFECPSFSWDHFVSNCLRLVQERVDRRTLMHAAAHLLPALPQSSTQYDSCAICFDAYTEDQKVATLPCGHVFHTACVSRWLSAAAHRNCPVCRRVTQLHSVQFARFTVSAATSQESRCEEKREEKEEEQEEVAVVEQEQEVVVLPEEKQEEEEQKEEEQKEEEQEEEEEDGERAIEEGEVEAIEEVQERIIEEGQVGVVEEVVL